MSEISAVYGKHDQVAKIFEKALYSSKDPVKDIAHSMVGYGKEIEFPASGGSVGPLNVGIVTLLCRNSFQNKVREPPT